MSTSLVAVALWPAVLYAALVLVVATAIITLSWVLGGRRVHGPVQLGVGQAFRLLAQERLPVEGIDQADLVGGFPDMKAEIIDQVPFPPGPGFRPFLNAFLGC